MDQNQKVLQSKLGEINREAEERDAERRAKRTGYEYVDLRKVPIALDALKNLPEGTAKEAKAATIEMKLRKIALAVFDPHAPATQEVLRLLEQKKLEVKVFVASLSGLTDAWRFYKFVPDTAKDISGKVGIEEKRFQDFLARLTTFGAVQSELANVDFHKVTTTDIFEIVLAGALANKASDIHFEAEEKTTKIRFRLDGLLHDVFADLPARTYQSLLSRIKLLSGLKINVYGEPQDGRFTIQVPGKEIEMRVSIIPSEFGETIVMRILDPDAIHVSLEALGLREDSLALVRKEIARPNGLILNTGPTGSGKTTTLYSFLQTIANSETKLITIEDPIEYRVPGIEQTQVNPEVGYTFADGLRAIMRQDPDVILVGEIRDHETADIAMQASLTGHLVFSTLHANDAVSSIPRLLDLGIKPQTVGPALSLVIAQRLVRVLCATCKKAVAITPDLEKKAEAFLAGLPEHIVRPKVEEVQIFEPVGCDACNMLGYKGRVGIFEFLEAGPEFEELILKESSEIAMRKLAKSQGMISFQDDGIIKVLRGVTGFDEVEKITGPIAWR
jgi:type IV pilus assembly protein PilB